jgi:ribosomal protein L7/L12
MPEFNLTFSVLSFAIVLFILAKIAGKVDAVNRKLEMLMKHSGMNVEDLATQVVQAMLRDVPFNKIMAIKRYRELTGTGLAEAKEAVERIQEDARTA